MAGKKITDLVHTNSAKLTDLLMIHDGNGLKAINVEEFNSCVSDNAGAHNSIFRGKRLGERVTDEQYSHISDGTFKDLFIGDYWMINGINYRIAGFDYYLGTGTIAFNKHHVVIVPDSVMYESKMNDTETVEGGYVGSKMYKEELSMAKTIIKADFANHVLSHSIYLANVVTNGHPSAGAWFESDIELMNENMVYGSRQFSPMNNGITLTENYSVEKSQLPLFVFAPFLINIQRNYWLRDVVSEDAFASVAHHGASYILRANIQNGVRPSFCIG